MNPGPVKGHKLPLYNLLGDDIETGTAYPSGTFVFNRSFYEAHISQSLDICVMFCTLLFVLSSILVWSYIYIYIYIYKRLKC
jgi:hypothetical protein